MEFNKTKWSCPWNSVQNYTKLCQVVVGVKGVVEVKGVVGVKGRGDRVGMVGVKG